MSLSSFLLSSKGLQNDKGTDKTLDKDLDAIFRANKPPTADNIGPSNKSEQKRKLNHVSEGPIKRAKSDSRRKVVDHASEVRGQSREDKIPSVSERKSRDQIKARSEKKAKERKSKDKDQEEDSVDIEDSYLTARSNGKKGKGVQRVDEQQAFASEEAEDTDGGDPSNLVHESLKKERTMKSKGSRPKKTKYVPQDETPEARDARTVFVGNVPIEVAKSRPLLKQLQKHLLSFIPSAKIESTRCRSVAFQAPTSKLPTSDDEADQTTKDNLKRKTERQARQHDVERVESWRESKSSKEEREVGNDEKKYLTPQAKKKIAFISHDFHPDVDTINVYVVFAHPIPGGEVKAHMDPFEAARLAVERCNGSAFRDHTIRVDHVGKGKTSAASATGIDGDTKSTLFIGNLDFACKEEDLRAFFEALLNAERGPPSDAHHGEDEGDGSESGVKFTKTWITRVRVIRDKDTQLGKGFAYVQFSDRDCVDEILGLEESKLKFAKRKLRVQRCKSMPSSSSTSNRRTSGTSSNAAPSLKPEANRATPKWSKPPVPVIPKGNPALGQKLVHLSKDDRKQAKASDRDRVARRLAKKKANMALSNKGVKAQISDRERIRKKPKGKSGSAPGREAKKSRVRSDKSALKKNVKK